MFTIIVALLSGILMTGYPMVLTYRYKDKLTCMAGMMIAMTAAMMSSLLIGTVFGTFTQGQLLMPTVVSILIGMAVGYYTGKPVSLMAAMDGMMSGIMGGMMGAMLGVMVVYQSPTIMIGFVNLIFIVVMSLLVKLIQEEARVIEKKKDTSAQEATGNSLSRLKWLVLPVVLVLLFVMMKTPGIGSSSLKNVSSGPAGATTTESVASNSGSTASNIQAKQKNGYQEVDIKVGTNGYTPDEIKLKAGVPTKLNFQKDYRGGCLSYLIMPDFNIQQALKQGTTTVEITPSKPGKYVFTCGMGMYGGYITVES
ncbi:cupredoxin domain-containing protein [Effusibacillus consociatus]|uniref:Cupredoxin domain-containing protein n=1 Tax=Effusibacillus consociatus TaxID=1117041 RepID=A0ABV9Q6V6_9BACL